MSRRHSLKYDEFATRINLEALYEAIGWEPIDTDARNNDYGYCLWPENHSHGDTTGKFAIQRDEMIYNCYVCGGGSLLSLAMELKDLDVEDATHWLYQFAGGDERTDQEFTEEFLAYFKDAETRATNMPYFNERVLDKFEPAPDWYLDARGIDRGVADEYKVGYDPQHMKKPPAKGKFAEDEPHVGPAIIFPVFWKDRLIGWQRRWVSKVDSFCPPEFQDVELPEWCKKYTNTSGFPKELVIYGWEEALYLSNRTGDRVIAVESVPTVHFLMSQGYLAVATFGSDINEAQQRLLRRFSNGVVLGEDNDSAGVKWRNSNTEYLKRYVPVWHLPPVPGKPGADIGDFASSTSPSKALKRYLDKAFRPELRF